MQLQQLLAQHGVQDLSEAHRYSAVKPALVDRVAMCGQPAALSVLHREYLHPVSAAVEDDEAMTPV